jgi:hypothetical protein
MPRWVTPCRSTPTPGGPGRGAGSLLWRYRDHDFPAWAGRDLTAHAPGARLVLLASDGATSATAGLPGPTRGDGQEQSNKDSRAKQRALYLPRQAVGAGGLTTPKKAASLPRRLGATSEPPPLQPPTSQDWSSRGDS